MPHCAHGRRALTGCRGDTLAPDDLVRLHGETFSYAALAQTADDLSDDSARYFAEDSFRSMLPWIVRRLARLRFPLTVWRGLAIRQPNPYQRIGKQPLSAGSWTWDPKAARAFALGTVDPVGVFDDEIPVLLQENCPVVLQAVVPSPALVSWPYTIASMYVFDPDRRHDYYRQVWDRPRECWFRQTVGGAYSGCDVRTAMFNNVGEREVHLHRGTSVTGAHVVFDPCGIFGPSVTWIGALGAVGRRTLTRRRRGPH